MQVHRFRNTAAIALQGKGETRYMTAREARKLARALNAIARSISREEFSASAGLTVGFATQPNAHSVEGN